MRLVRPALHCFVRAGRRLQAEPGAVLKARAFSGRGVVCATLIGDAGSSAGSTGRKREPTLSPCLTDVPKGGPLQAYAKLVLKGNIREDRHQVKTLHLLQQVRVTSRTVPFSRQQRTGPLITYLHQSRVSV